MKRTFIYFLSSLFLLSFSSSSSAARKKGKCKKVGKKHFVCVKKSGSATKIYKKVGYKKIYSKKYKKKFKVKVALLVRFAKGKKKTAKSVVYLAVKLLSVRSLHEEVTMPLMSLEAKQQPTPKKPTPNTMPEPQDFINWDYDQAGADQCIGNCGTGDGGCELGCMWDALDFFVGDKSGPG